VRVPRSRRTRAIITTAAALAATAAFAGPASANLGAFGPLAPVGFPSYYEDTQGVQLALCIDDPRCPSAPPVLEPVAPNDEAFYFTAASGVAGTNTISGGNATVDVEFAVEAAYLDPETPITFGRIQFTARGLQPDTEYTVEHPWGTSHFTTEPDGTLLGGKRAAQREETDGTFEDTLNTPIGPWLRSDAAPAGYLGDGITSTTVTGGPLRNNIRVFGPGLRDAVTDAGGVIIQPAGLTSDEFTVEGKLFDPTAPLPPAPVPVPPDTDKDGVIDSVDNCINQQGPASNNGCPLPIIIERPAPPVAAPPVAAPAAVPAPQVIPGPTQTIIVREPGVAVQGTTATGAGRLALQDLLPVGRITRAKLRAQGLRLRMQLEDGTRVVRILIFRTKRNGQRTGRPVFTTVRRVKATTTRITLRNRAVKRLKAGRYVARIQPGRNRADTSGVSSSVSFRVR
jgi:hypothetical protein